jgi:mono/diheme cytochrome c family protein
MEETAFYILGGTLIALALIVSFVGLKFENFPPSKGVIAGVSAVFVAVVLATAVFAWENGEVEQEHRNEEIAAGHLPSPQEGLEMAGEAVEEETPTESDDEGASEGEATATVDGAQVFADLGCGGCHRLADAGSSGTTGPDLDASLQGQDEQFIETSIVEPNEEIEEGFPPSVMPDSYGDQLSPEELDALVAYLSEVTSGGGS